MRRMDERVMMGRELRWWNQIKTAYSRKCQNLNHGRESEPSS